MVLILNSGYKVISSKVKHWCHLFKVEQTNVNGEKRSGQPNVTTDDLMENVE